MKNTILIKFSNGHWFEVPVEEIAKNRAIEYQGEFQEEVDYVLNNPAEAVDWMQNNMYWEDIQELGEFVNREEPFDYSDEFFNAEFEILEK